MKKIIIIFLMFLSVNVANAMPISVSHENGIYHVVLSGDSMKKRIKFVSSENLISNKEAHLKGNSELTINAGFFDPKNERTISYIVTDGNVAEDPRFNQDLISNPSLSRNLDKIFNRTEFRVVECSRKYHYEIVPHNSNVDFGCNIITSAQGGPLILPELRLEEEFFIQKDEEGHIIRESCSVLHKVARTIIGIKGDDAHILIITDENPMDMYEVQKLCNDLGFDRAMGFDGGSSTSMNYKNIEVVSTVGDGGGRLLKSFMIIKK